MSEQMVFHPIAYPCGCVRVLMVYPRGWEQSVGDKNHVCSDHLKEIRALGLWGGARKKEEKC